MEEGLKIRIGADTVQVTKSLGQLQDQLKRFQENLKTATNPQTIERLNKAILRTNQYIGGIKSAGLKDIPVQADNAGYAISNLARIASDAPYGFIAIQNNLDPFIQSLGSLSKATGGAGGALKALGASLIGPQGVFLGFTLVSSALTYFALHAKKAKDEISGLEKAQKDANKESGAELAKLRLLIAVAQDTTRAMKERLQAVKELQLSQKETFGGLTKEIILNGDLSNAIRKTTAAIIQKAKATAYSNRLAELSSEELDNLQSTIQAVNEYDKALKDLNKQKSIQSNVTGAIADVSAATVGAERRLLDAKQAIEDLAIAGKKLRSEQSFITDLIVRNDVKLPDELLAQSSKKVKIKQGPELPELEVKPVLIFQGSDAQKERDKISAVLQGEKNDIKALTIPINISSLDKTIELIKAKGIEAGTVLRDTLNTDRLKSVANAIYENVTPAFQGLFETLISGSGNALQAVGKFLKDIMKRLAAAVIQAAAFAGIMSAFGLGGGASFGQLFSKNLLGGFGIKGAAAPGNAVGRGLALNAAPSERLVASISGNDLNLILQRTQKSLNRLG